MPFQAIKPKNITIDLVGARDRNRTGTAVTRRGILSPLCLPISPPGRVSWGLGFGLMQQRAAIYYCAGAAVVVIATLNGGAGRNRTGVHGFAIRCITTLLPRHNFASVLSKNFYSRKKSLLAGANCFEALEIWSGKRDSNSRPQPWQGCALPTELSPQLRNRTVLPYFPKGPIVWTDL